MKKISFENLHEKKQHLYILDTLYHSLDGFTLHELTYLLTLKTNMQLMSKLQEKFGRERLDIFRTRQRINDCLNQLKRINLIVKEDKRYKIDYFGLMEYTKFLEMGKQIEEFLEQMRNEYKDLAKDYRNVQKSEQEEVQSYAKFLFKKQGPPWRKYGYF